MSYRYERLTTDNFADLEALFDVVYPNAWDHNLMRRKFDTSVFGHEKLGFLAYDESSGEAAAFYGVFPLPVKVGGQTYTAAQSGDTMTHSSHRGKGLFVTLAKKTYDLCREVGIDFVFGYPNPNSYKGFVKHLGWTHAYDMLGWNRFLPTLPLGRIFKFLKLKRQHSVFTRWILRHFFDVLSPLEAASALAALPNRNGVIHDVRFATYKNHSGIVLRHKTALLWVSLSSDVALGMIGDHNNGKDVASAIKRLSIVCVLSGINRIKSYFSPGSTMHQLLAGVGMLRTSNPYGYRLLNESIDIKSFETVMADYDTF